MGRAEVPDTFGSLDSQFDQLHAVPDHMEVLMQLAEQESTSQSMLNAIDNSAFHTASVVQAVECTDRLIISASAMDLQIRDHNPTKLMMAMIDSGANVNIAPK